MPNDKFESASRFSHIHRITETRLLIQSVCKTCGTAQVVSVHDGSLQQWEGGHCCEPQAKAADKGS